MKDIKDQDNVVIAYYHHYRRKDGRVWHWTSDSWETPNKIPSDALEIQFERFPEIPFKKLSRAESDEFW